jgi:hypothetical protein
MLALSVNAEDGGSITKPKVLASYAHKDKRFIHGLRWPNAGSDKFLLGGGETNFQPQCTPTVGAFMVFDSTRASAEGAWTQTDEKRPQNGTYLDGNSRAQILGCSAHWFEEHPRSRTAASSPWPSTSRARASCRSRPRARSASSASRCRSAARPRRRTGRPTGRTVYAIDYTRGLDVLRYDGPLVVPDERGNVDGPSRSPRRASRAQREGAAQTATPGTRTRDAAAPAAARAAPASPGRRGRGARPIA